MSGWRLPTAAAAFAAGLLVAPIVGHFLPVLLWLGAAAVIGLLAGRAAPSPGPDALGSAGLVPSEDGVVQALAPRALRRRLGPPWLGAVLVAAAIVLAGVGWGTFHRHRVEGALLRGLAPAHVEVEGTLREDPTPRTLGWSSVLDVRVVTSDGRASTLRETIWLSGHGEPIAAVRGDRVSVSGIVRVPTEGGFAASMVRRGIVAELSVGEAERLGPSSNPLIRAAQIVRGVVGRSIRSSFAPREAGLLLGLALGDDSGLDEGVERDFRATGLGHLLVVSGENVAMVLAPVLGLGLALRLGRRTRFALGLGTVVFFVVLTGAEPSVLRAGVMAGLALTGTVLGRPGGAASALCGAVVALLVIDPALVWSVGFQLSVVATASMVALATSVAERLWFLPRPVALASGATLAAQLGVTPVLLFHFGEVPLVTAIANVLAFPAVSPALLLGLGAAGTGLVAPGVARPLAALAGLPLRYLQVVADRLSTAPVPWVTSAGGAAVLVLGMAAVVGVVVWMRSGRRLAARSTAISLGVVLTLVAWTSAIGAGPPGRLTVRFLDVGQGDAALVTSPRGATVLIDAGPDEAQVATELSALGVKRLDVAVATHPHADHVAGFPSVFARIPVGLVLEPGCDEPSPSYDAFLRAIADEDLPVRHPRAGETLVAADLRIDVLAPAGCWTATASDPNNDSLVLRVSIGDDVVLFPGDAEEPSQEELLHAGTQIQADVLKVPHHGGDTSVAEFLEGVGASVAVVSVGQPNDYGHPVPEVLQTLRDAGSTVLRTDQLGDVIVTFGPQGRVLASAA
ncbi:MAG TPA: DNA internalization-related competence protein ComEC/Rec2 [Actinomycetota bacterium]|nr:DNA internalization-related competence protein ComEC/Rec2 [Actinomycetota bacterium]